MFKTEFGFWSDDHPILAAVLVHLVSLVVFYPIAWLMGHPQPALIALGMPLLIGVFGAVLGAIILLFALGLGSQ